MKALVTTATIPVARRLTYWQDAVCDVFVDLDCRSASDRDFFGEIETERYDSLHFSLVRSRDQNVYRTPARIRAAKEEVMLISVQTRGTGLVVQDGREARLLPGDFACYDSTRPYTLSFNDDFEQLVLHMPRNALLDRIGRTELLTARAVRGTSPMGSVAVPFLRQVASVVGDADPQTATRLCEISLALVTTALGELVERERQNEPDAQSWTRTALTYRAKAFIEENLHDPELNPARVADAVGISLRYLQVLFHAQNAAVSDWIWSRRLDRSRRRLTDPLLAHESIAQIAFGCGFTEFAHFSRRFKGAYAMSPRDYRAAHGVAAK
jgi:AraC-like DNA-binding protein